MYVFFPVNAAKFRFNIFLFCLFYCIFKNYFLLEASVFFYHTPFSASLLPGTPRSLRAGRITFVQTVQRIFRENSIFVSLCFEDGTQT